MSDTDDLIKQYEDRLAAFEERLRRIERGSAFAAPAAQPRRARFSGTVKLAQFGNRFPISGQDWRGFRHAGEYSAAKESCIGHPA